MRQLPAFGRRCGIAATRKQLLDVKSGKRPAFSMPPMRQARRGMPPRPGGLAIALGLGHMCAHIRNPHPKCAFPRVRRRGRAAEGGGLLNRYRVVKPYRGFESPRLRQPSFVSFPARQQMVDSPTPSPHLVLASLRYLSYDSQITRGYGRR